MNKTPECNNCPDVNVLCTIKELNKEIKRLVDKQDKTQEDYVSLRKLNEYRATVLNYIIKLM